MGLIVNSEELTSIEVVCEVKKPDNSEKDSLVISPAVRGGLGLAFYKAGEWVETIFIPMDEALEFSKLLAQMVSQERSKFKNERNLY